MKVYYYLETWKIIHNLKCIDRVQLTTDPHKGSGKVRSA